MHLTQVVDCTKDRGSVTCDGTESIEQRRRTVGKLVQKGRSRCDTQLAMVLRVQDSYQTHLLVVRVFD